MRILFMFGGLVFVGLGILGAFLPVMPSTVFFIIAAVFFARSNPEWEAKIMNHPKIGPPIRAFRERGAIGQSAKIAAVSAMAVSSVVSAILLHGYWRFAPAAVCAVCALFILTRPSE
ncbi:YbaN family protein [Asticcacaulis sp. 201]|uniref:YbaN family protein n=1 Tax=Asticcacaulis sp. 201 TaxID=3028787 RepID=UPI002916A0F6|nr:YbaN family protein [Asticcacaulis sp. 201]MDV6329206.1 YbaN family protein [Asticcacaulis sp. 201]